MSASGSDRGSGSGPSLRGWLSELYFPTLLDDATGERAVASLANRLGAKATVDDPVQGRAIGQAAIASQLTKTGAWLREHAATYTQATITTGTDRDVAVGTASLTAHGKRVDLPVAVVAERRRSREVELRVYYAIRPLTGETKTRAPLVTRSTELSLHPPVTAFFEALAAGDVNAVAATFEHDGSVYDGSGVPSPREGGALAAVIQRLVARGRGEGLRLHGGGSADDGRTCAFELTLPAATNEAAPEPALLLFERGDSGLLRALRFYGDTKV